MNENKHSITALVSCFSRAYHSENNDVKIFNDSLAKSFITNEEYLNTSQNMKNGIKFLNPSFDESKEDVLEWIVNNQLCPTPLGRAAFAEEMLGNAVKVGASQYLIFGAGMDSFAFRQPNFARNITIFEIDHPNTQTFKKKRINELEWQKEENVEFISIDLTECNWEEMILNNSEFSTLEISYCTLLGLVYYLTKTEFQNILQKLFNLIPEGSSIVFDYPDENTFTSRSSDRVQRQIAMAKMSGEEMLASYSYTEIEKMLDQCGFLIYEHLTPAAINQRYFTNYNNANNDKKILPFENVNYCLAVKKRVVGQYL